MWRFWLYRTADTVTSSSAPAAEVSWKYLGADPLTKIDLSEASNDITVSTSLKATTSPVKWVRKAGVYGLEDASPLNDEVLQAVAARLQTDPSVYIRSVAAGTLGCLGRRAIATRVGESLVPACLGDVLYFL